jgi:cytochrome c2
MKSILALFFLVAASIAVVCMLNLMGKTERKISTKVLRRTHKAAGISSAVSLFIISYFCIKYWITVGDQLSTRAVLHGFLALALLIVFIMKLSIVRFYKQFLRFVPVMGMTVFAMSFVVFSTSAGYYFLRTLCKIPKTTEVKPALKPVTEGNASNGAALFKSKCSFCHYADSEDRKNGPGLKNILKKEKLPSSGREATLDNVKRQLETPFLAMPSFKFLSEQELADLLAYLKTL